MKHAYTSTGVNTNTSGSLRDRIKIVPETPPVEVRVERSKESACGECRKYKRELKQRDEQIERLLAALRRESHHIDRRADRSGYDSVRLHK